MFRYIPERPKALPPLDPLSKRVLPVLLFGCENRIMTDHLADETPGCFQDKLVNRDLRWPKNLYSTAAVVMLGLPSVRYGVGKEASSLAEADG